MFLSPRPVFVYRERCWAAEEEGTGKSRCSLPILIGGNPSDSSELFRVGLESGGMGGTGYSGIGLGRLVGSFILEGSLDKFVLLYLAWCCATGSYVECVQVTVCIMLSSLVLDIRVLIRISGACSGRN